MIKLLRAVVGVAIGVVFLWLALRGQNIEDVRAVWARLEASWLLFGTAVYAGGLLVRVARWSCLLAVLGPVRAQDVGEVLLVGNAVNNILPARLGELVRADYGKRRLAQTRSALLATIVVERLADLATIVAALLCGILVLEPVLRDAGRPWHIINLVAAFGAGLFVIVLTAVALLPRSERLSGWLPQLARPRLDDVVMALRSWAEVRKIRFLLLTLGVWGLEATALACILRASGIDAGVFQLLLVLGLANLGTLIPTAPAYLGSYQFSYVLAFSALGWSSAQGIAVATAAQVVLLAPVTLAGILVLILRTMPAPPPSSWTRGEGRRAVGSSTLTVQRRANEGP